MVCSSVGLSRLFPVSLYLYLLFRLRSWVNWFRESLTEVGIVSVLGFCSCGIVIVKSN
uniref:Uncharacterized protein n=1 Tax=Arundo donax TaxID=35708 RepID=A0A0A9APX5_ARUDO